MNEQEQNKQQLPIGQPWLVGMYHNRLNPMEHKISLRTCFEKKELQALLEQASAAVPPPAGKEGEYVPTVYTSEVRLPMGPGMVLPIEVCFEVYDENVVKLNQTLYGFARSQVEGKESPIIKP